MRVWEIPEFSTGLGAGVVAAAVLLVAAIASRRLGHRTPLPLSGLAMAAAALWAIDQARAVPTEVGIAAVVVAGAAAITSYTPAPRWLTPVAAAPGAWLVATRGELVDETWVIWLAGATIAVGAALAQACDDAWAESAAVPGLFAASVAGVYFCVPDTEEAAALLGVALPLAALGWPFGLARLGGPGAAAAVTVLVWVAAVGGRGRLPSIVGALACLALVAAIPVGRWLVRTQRRLGRGVGSSDRNSGGRPPVVLVAAIHLVAVVVASRVAGVADELTTAVPVAVGVMVGSVAVSVAIAAAPSTEARSANGQ